MNLFETYCNNSKPRAFKATTKSKTVEELTKYVSCNLTADVAELLCAEFDIDVVDDKPSTAKKLASRFIAECLYSHPDFVRARMARHAHTTQLELIRTSRNTTSAMNSPSGSVCLAMPPGGTIFREATPKTNTGLSRTRIAELEAKLAELLLLVEHKQASSTAKASKPPKASKPAK